MHKFNKENQRWQFSNDAMKSAAKTAQTWSKVKGKSTIKQFPCRKEFNDKTCICGTDLCKQTMVNYFNNYHDYDWPDKLFPWLHVGIPKWPLDHVRSTTRGSRTLKRANIRTFSDNFHLIRYLYRSCTTSVVTHACMSTVFAFTISEENALERRRLHCGWQNPQSRATVDVCRKDHVSLLSQPECLHV